MSVILETSSVEVPTEVPVLDFCKCDYNCDFVQIALAGSNTYETDRTPLLLFNPDTISGSVEFKIKNVDSGMEYVLSGPTYGSDFPLGSFSSQPLRAGYLVDWGKVSDVIGFGRYRLLTTNNFNNKTINTESHIYHCMEYTVERADGTVRIEAVQNGCIEGGVDYTGMNWLLQVRIPGKFGFVQPTLVTDEYESTTRVITQVQDQMIDNFSLQTTMLPSFIMDPIYKDSLLGDTIKITDYNVISYRDIRDLEVRPTNIAEVDERWGSINADFLIEFQEAVQNIIKRR